MPSSCPTEPAAAACREPAPGRGAAMLAWLAHPVTLVALVVLAVNDHLGKATYPGLVTGKLSDLAGLVLAPPLLATALLLVPRLPATAAAVAAMVATAVGFSAVQLSPGLAELASQVWSAVAGPSRLYPDATDLVALPALAVAWWAWRRARRRPLPHRLVRLARALVVLPAAMLAVSATSLVYPYAAAVAEWEGGLVAGETNSAAQYEHAPTWRFSDDAGRNWRTLLEADRERLAADLPGAQTVRRQACLPGDKSHCYRVVIGALRVQESRDGGVSWRTSWEVTESQRQALARHYPSINDSTRELSSVALAVHTTHNGHVVLVANGRDGFALRAVDGQWHRIGFPTREARVPHWDDRLRTTVLPYGVLWGLVAAALAVPIVLETVRRPASRRWWRWLAAAPGLLVIAAGLAWLIGFNADEPSDGLFRLLWLFIGAMLIGFGLLLWLLEPLLNRAISGWQWLAMVPGAGLVGALTAAPLLVISHRHPAAIAGAVLLFGVATTGLAVVTWQVGAATRHRGPGPTALPAQPRAL